MCQDVLVEAYVPGRDHRVLVVGDKIVAAAELSAARVTGDGRSTIAELVAIANTDPARGEGHDLPLTRLALGDTELCHLARQGLHPGVVPAADEVVVLRRNANLSTGGTSKDVTDHVHPDVARLCRRVAATVGLDVCGIDLRLPEIGAPLPPDAVGVGVIEVNASPGLRMHLAPYEGQPRDVAAEIIGQMYPEGTSARVPLVSVTGTNGKTTAVRMIAHLLGAGRPRRRHVHHRRRLRRRRAHLQGGRLRAPVGRDGPRQPDRRDGRAGDRARRHRTARARLRPGRRRRHHQRHRRPLRRRRHRHGRGPRRDQGAGRRGDPPRRPPRAERRRSARARARRASRRTEAEPRAAAVRDELGEPRHRSVTWPPAAPRTSPRTAGWSRPRVRARERYCRSRTSPGRSAAWPTT